MNLEQQEKIVLEALEDVKGHDIRAFDTTPLTSLFDRVFIATGTSNRQTSSMANEVVRQARKYALDVVAIEGQTEGEWVLIDLGDIVVQCMQDAIRDYFKLVDLWCDHLMNLFNIIIISNIAHNKSI